MIVIYEKPGRMANCIWLYAHFVAFSAEFGVPVSFPAFGEYGRYFRSTSNSLMYNYPERKSVLAFSFLRNVYLKVISFFVKACQKLKLKPGFIEMVSLRNDNEMNLEETQNVTLLSKRVVLLKGWLYRADQLIAKHKSKILVHFEPAPEYQKNVDALIENCRKECELLVGVHLRREDYRTFLDGIYFYELSDYKAKMNEVQQLYKEKKVGFLICSNEQIESEGFEGLKIFKGNDHIIEDMYSFAKCDLILGPPSTYSMWASFYGNVPLYQIKKIGDPIGINDFKVVIN